MSSSRNEHHSSDSQDQRASNARSRSFYADILLNHLQPDSSFTDSQGLSPLPPPPLLTTSSRQELSRQMAEFEAFRSQLSNTSSRVGQTSENTQDHNYSAGRFTGFLSPATAARAARAARSRNSQTALTDGLSSLVSQSPLHTRQAEHDSNQPSSATQSSQIPQQLTGLSINPEEQSSSSRQSQSQPVSFPFIHAPEVLGTVNPHNLFTDESHKTKRRRLDTYCQPSHLYGRYGQVEPGPLQMEIVQDNGSVFMPCASSINNILLPDVRSYDFDVTGCNIVLQHQNGTPFSLQKIVIRSPTSRIADIPPVGLLFLSMEKDDVFRRTAAYQIRTSNTSQHRLLAEDITGRQYRSMYEEDEEECDDIPLEFKSSPPKRGSIKILTENEDLSSDNESVDSDEYRVRDFIDINADTSFDSEPGEASAVYMGLSHYHSSSRTGFPPRSPPNRIGTLPFENDDSDIAFPIRRPARFSERNSGIGRLRGSSSNFLNRLINQESTAAMAAETPRRPADSSATGLEAARQASQLATQNAVRAVGGSFMVPQARFVMDKTKCTIEFDPPLAACNILLKIWCPQNISPRIYLQSVEVIGFAGPRYLPSVELR
ncbi:hypothetical protein HOO65_020434 [Ceratocystis lukuohia]|uniref:Uncharacterized protein n=1 Tax=Ceratocystis lukuohia TaxID=2019550 RepID=A0ABR4MNN2_9PEZI